MSESLNFLGFDQLEPGVVNKLYFTVRQTSETDAIFNVRKNGVSLFSGNNRPKILAGQKTVVKDGLNIQINQFDLIEVDLESGNAIAPINVGFKYKDDIWTGTQAAYDALTPDGDTLYFIEE